MNAINTHLPTVVNILNSAVVLCCKKLLKLLRIYNRRLYFLVHDAHTYFKHCRGNEFCPLRSEFCISAFKVDFSCAFSALSSCSTVMYLSLNELIDFFVNASNLILSFSNSLIFLSFSFNFTSNKCTVLVVSTQRASATPLLVLSGHDHCQAHSQLPC